MSVSLIPQSEALYWIRYYLMTFKDTPSEISYETLRAYMKDYFENYDTNVRRTYEFLKETSKLVDRPSLIPLFEYYKERLGQPTQP